MYIYIIFIYIFMYNIFLAPIFKQQIVITVRMYYNILNSKISLDNGLFYLKCEQYIYSE